ncbi:MAG: hypothetical protein WD030_01790, partial [Pirellulales bacterium]
PLADAWTGDNNDPWGGRWSVEEYSSSGGQTRTTDIQGNRGRMQFSTNSEAAEVVSYLTISPAQDVDVRVQFEVDDATERFGLVARGSFSGDTEFGNDADDTYLAADVGNGEVRLRRVDAGTSSSLTTAGSYTLSTSTKYWLRLWVETADDETRLKVKVWADSASEPDAWTLTATDTDVSQLSAGHVGLYFAAPSTVSTATFLVDEVLAVVGDLPAAPSAMVARAVSDSRIDASWIDESNYESGFALDGSNDGSSWTQLGVSGEGEVNYGEAGLAENTTRHYRVRSLNDAIRADAWTGTNNDPWDPRWQVEEYSATGGQTRDLDIQSNRGEVSFTTNSEATEIVAYQTVSRAEDVNLLAQFELDDTTERFGLVARGDFGAPTTFGNGSSDTYLVADAGNGQVRLRRVDAGTSSDLTTAGSVSLSTSTKYWIRLLVVTNAGDTDLKVKVWEDGDPEPGSWDL